MIYEMICSMKIEDLKESFRILHPDWEKWEQKEWDKKILLNFGIMLEENNV